MVHWTRRSTLGAAALILGLGSLALGQTAVKAITIPSAEVTLSFVQPGRLTQILFKEGDTVKKGDLVATLDDQLERIRLEQAKAKASDTTQIEASQASLDQKRVDLTKLELAAQRGAATTLEVEHARLDVRIAELSLQLARFEHQMTRYAQQEAQILVDRLKLTSPVDGRVEKVSAETGESVNALQEILQIVSVDPLWIDANIDFAVACRLQPGTTIHVKFPRQGNIVPGKVVHVSSVGNAAVGTLRVRIAVPNPGQRPAGEQVEVMVNTVSQPS